MLCCVVLLRTDITPYRKEHYSAIGGANPATRWALAGYDPAGAASYLSALNRTMAWGKNVAGALKFPGRNTLLAAVTPITAEIGRGEHTARYCSLRATLQSQKQPELGLGWCTGSEVGMLVGRSVKQ